MSSKNTEALRADAPIVHLYDVEEKRINETKRLKLELKTVRKGFVIARRVKMHKRSAIISPHGGNMSIEEVVLEALLVNPDIADPITVKVGDMFTARGSTVITHNPGTDVIINFKHYCGYEIVELYNICCIVEYSTL